VTDAPPHRDEAPAGGPRQLGHSTSRYHEEQQLDNAIAALELGEPITGYLRHRYLDYLRWLEDGATAHLRLYYSLRIPALVLAATVPALVALNLGTVGRAITVALGVAVAAAVGVENFLNSGRRWRHYRGTVERMKSEAWLYLELTGDYAQYSTHDAAFPSFVSRAEEFMRSEVGEYVTSIVAEHRRSDESKTPD
jgi:hypothetical protein